MPVCLCVHVSACISMRICASVDPCDHAAALVVVDYLTRIITHAVWKSTVLTDRCTVHHQQH